MRRRKQDRNVILGAQLLEYLLLALLVPLMLQGRYKPWLDLVKRVGSSMCVDLRLVLRIKLLCFMICDAGDLPVDVLVRLESSRLGCPLQQVIVDDFIERLFAQIIKLRGNFTVDL